MALQIHTQHLFGTLVTEVSMNKVRMSVMMMMIVTHDRADEIPPPWQPPSDLSQSTSSCSLSLHSGRGYQMVLDTGVICHTYWILV